MNQRNDNSNNQRQASGQQEQNQSNADRQKGMHPGSDRDDYGAPESDSGRVGERQFEQEGREPAQQGENDRRSGSDQFEQGEADSDRQRERERQNPGMSGSGRSEAGDSGFGNE